MRHLVVDIVILLSVQVAVFGKSAYSPYSDHCHEPSDDPNAKFFHLCDNVEINGTCTFECINNFIAKENGELTCKDGAKWFPEEPYCEDPIDSTSSEPSTSTSSEPSTSTSSEPSTPTSSEPTSSSSSEPSSSTTLDPVPLCCPNITAREIQWGHCGKSENVTRPCPKESAGMAWWFCNTTKGEWIPSEPNLENCKSNDIDVIISKVNVSEVDKALDLLQSANPRFGGDLLAIGGKLTQVVDNIEDFLQTLPPEQRRDGAINITEQVTTLGDTMLSEKGPWQDLTKEKLVNAATDLLNDEEITAFQCAYNLNANETKLVVKTSFAMQIMKSDSGTYGEGLTLSSAYSSSKTTKFKLPSNFENAIDDPQANGTIVVFFEYKDLGDLLVTKSSEVFSSSSAEKRSETFTSSSSVNSPVLSVSLNKHNLNVTFQDKAVYVVPHIRKNTKKPVCAFWNTNSLNWDTTGCTLVRADEEYTECACNHLTNFAVLMDIHGVIDTLTEEDLDRLEAITVIGCMISIIFLSVAIVVTTVYRKLWGMKNTVHRNLAICLMIGETILLAGGGGSENKMLCPYIAGLLHYFFTAAFCWMFLEAVVIYLLLFVRYSPEKRYRKRFWAFGYGVPGFIVFISFISRPAGYGSDTHCWLNNDKGFMWSFVGPVTLILTVNIVALVYAVYVLKTGRNIQNEMGPPVTSKWILEALAYVPFLGTTWIIGFAMVKSQPASVYAFTVLNSLQGFAIFIFECVLDPDSRACLKRSFNKYTYLSQPEKADSRVSSGGKATNSANHVSSGGTATNSANHVSSGGTETNSANHPLQRSAPETSPQPEPIYASVPAEEEPYCPRCSHKSQSPLHAGKPEAQNSVPTPETEAPSQNSSLSAKDSDTESSRIRNSTSSSGNDSRGHSLESSQNIPTQEAQSNVSRAETEAQSNVSRAETEAPSLSSSLRNKNSDTLTFRLRDPTRSTAQQQRHSSESSQSIPANPNNDTITLRVSPEVLV